MQQRRGWRAFCGCWRCWRGTIGACGPSSSTPPWSCPLPTGALQCRCASYDRCALNSRLQAHVDIEWLCLRQCLHSQCRSCVSELGWTVLNIHAPIIAGFRFSNCWGVCAGDVAGGALLLQRPGAVGATGPDAGRAAAPCRLRPRLHRRPPGVLHMTDSFPIRLSFPSWLRILLQVTGAGMRIWHKLRCHALSMCCGWFVATRTRCVR